MSIALNNLKLQSHFMIQIKKNLIKIKYLYIYLLLISLNLTALNLMFKKNLLKSSCTFPGFYVVYVPPIPYWKLKGAVVQKFYNILDIGFPCKKSIFELQ